MKDGILDKKYIEKRSKFSTYKTRFIRRAYECATFIDKKIESEQISLLDLGCADCSSFEYLKKYSNKKIDYTGLEYNLDLLSINKKRINKICADINHLPFKDKPTFDVIILTAVLEHVQNPETLLNNLSSILKKDGLILITMPDPFFEKIASFLKNIEESDYHNPICKKELQDICPDTLKIIKYKKFMISPYGFVFEHFIEIFYPSILMMNQFIALKKINI